MKKHQTKILVGIISILALWIAILISPANDFISLTGIYHLPIPEHAKSPPVDPEKEYYLEEIADGVHFLAGWSHNTMFVVAEESVVVLDAPPSIGEDYLAAIREVTDKPVSHLIYSHSHDDHIGSAHLFKNATIIAHKATADILKERNDPERPLPTVTFDRAYALDVGGKRIELAYHGPAHGPGNIAVHLPEEKVLAMIDIAFPKWVPIHEFAIAEDLNAYFHIYDALLSYDFTSFIGGHANLGTYEDVRRQHEYVIDIRNSAAAALKAVDFKEVGRRSANSGNTYVAVQFGFDRMASNCEREVVEKWQGKLAGVDVFTYSHCMRAVFHALTD